MRAFVVPNFHKAETAAILEQLARLAKQYDLELFSGSWSDDNPSVPEITLRQAEQLARCDVLIAIGGDGTIMHCARLGAPHNKPIMGINAGKLGFLAQAEPRNLEQCVRQLTGGDFTVEYRGAIAAGFSDERLPPLDFAINDLVIQKAAEYNIAQFDISCNHREIDSYRADGLIFSTSTGSTAYNLSAGGPVIDPLLDTITLVPICPHSLSVSTLVFSERRVITVCSAETPLTVIADGNSRRMVPAGTAIQVAAASCKAGFVTFREQEFFEILTTKIKQRR